MRVNHIMFFAAIALATGMAGGCKSNSTGPDVDPGITEANLFPFGVGRLYVYSAYTLDTLGVKVQSSTHREVTYVQGTVTIGGKSGYRLVDSVYFTDGTISHVDNTYFTVENGNLLTYQGGAWITLFKPSAGINTEYDGGSFIGSAFGIQVSVTVKCKINPKENVTTSAGTFPAYKLQVKTGGSFGGVTFQILQYVWFADGVGPVKLQEPPQVDPIFGSKATGTESLLVSKNF